MSARSVEIPPPKGFGFCEGVEAAHGLLTRVVDVALLNGIVTVYGHHDIVHNADVAAYHEERGVVFVDNIGNVPDKSLVVGSAHGSSPEVENEVSLKHGLFIDGACALVKHTHRAVHAARENDEKLIYIMGSNPDHDEVVGTLGHAEFYLDSEGVLRDDMPVSVLKMSVDITDATIDDMISVLRLKKQRRFRIVGQTTLIASDVQSRIDALAGKLDVENTDITIARLDAKRQVCFAVEDRQNAIKEAMNDVGSLPETVVVITDPNSKNGMSYVDLANSLGGDKVSVHAVDGPDGIREISDDINGKRVFITASASTPDDVTREVIDMIGGDRSSVPDERPSFRIPGTTYDELDYQIKGWMAS
jgi:4-hydroxy-3-methylbut-2-enyl diphosphate reductase